MLRPTQQPFTLVAIPQGLRVCNCDFILRRDDVPIHDQGWLFHGELPRYHCRRVNAWRASFQALATPGSASTGAASVAVISLIRSGLSIATVQALSPRVHVHHRCVDRNHGQHWPAVQLRFREICGVRSQMLAVFEHSIRIRVCSRSATDHCIPHLHFPAFLGQGRL
jgi:hypothetical protein